MAEHRFNPRVPFMRPKYLLVYTPYQSGGESCCAYLVDVRNAILIGLRKKVQTAASIAEAMLYVSRSQARKIRRLPSSHPNLRMTHTLL